MKPSRRTVAKGAAWTAPAVAVAAAAPPAAASPFVPPPPVFNFAGGCATVGNGNGGCNGAQKTGQVPVTIKNPAGAPSTVVFQIISVASENANGSGDTTVFTVYTNNGKEDACGPQITSTGCGGYISISLAPGQCKAIWVVSGTLQSSGAFNMNVTYRWIEPCTPPVTPTNPVVIVAGPTTTGAVNIGSSNNCDSSVVTTGCP